MIQPIFCYGILDGGQGLFVGVNVSGDETFQEIANFCQPILVENGQLLDVDGVTIEPQFFESDIVEGVEFTVPNPQRHAPPYYTNVLIYYVCESYPDKCATNHQSQQDACPDRRHTCEASALSLAHVCQIKEMTLDNAYHKFIEWIGNNCHFGQLAE